MIKLADFVQEHPDAVFVRRTQATSFEDLEAFHQGGHAIAQDLLAADSSGSDERTFVLKPNVVHGRVRDDETGELTGGDQGIVTHPEFVAGIVQRLQELGARKIVVAEGGGPIDMGPVFEDQGYARMAEEMGVELADLNQEAGQYGEDELNWTPVAGVVFKEIPFVRPINDPDVVFINVPTMKTHNLGIISLCGKALQGTIATGYRHFCSDLEDGVRRVPGAAEHYQPNLMDGIRSNFEAHRQSGYPHWDVNGTRLEAYAQRTCDAVMGINGYFNIIEGVTGRDGTAFRQGKDHLTNLSIAGINPVTVDAIAAYLMGHDPTRIGFLRLAAERGLGIVDPSEVPVFLLTEDGPEACCRLDEIGRTELGVYFLGDASEYVFF